jgi:cysteine synthase B
MSAVATCLAIGDLISRIGNTPLLKIKLASQDKVPVYAKAEFFNPGGSVKDRPALNMVRKGEERGELVPGKILLDSTSGNTGIAYAMICSAKGYPVKLCLPANASPERKQILNAYGAELVLTNPAEGSDGAFRECQKIYQANPEAYFYPNQYGNPANWQAHFQTTGPEIVEQTEGQITHFVAALGTTGTFMAPSTCRPRSSPRSMIPALRTIISGWKPKMLISWRGVWRGKKVCSSASQRRRTF